MYKTINYSKNISKNFRHLQSRSFYNMLYIIYKVYFVLTNLGVHKLLR